ncbi:MAG: MFS transporter [Candidatus Bathyarchaeota archaeon]
MSAPSLRERLKDMYFGWYTVLAGAIIACWGYGSWYYGMSALFTPLIAEYGWTRAQLSAAFSMRSIEGGLEGPIGGMLIDRYGPKKITIISTIIASLGLLLVLFVRDIWQFVIVWGFVVSLGFNLGLYDTVNAAVAKWFVRKRGRAISLVTIGGGLGAPVVVPVMTWIIVNYGWRSALIFVSLSTLVICLPLAWFWMKDHPPEHYGLLPDGDTVIKTSDVEDNDRENAIEEYEFTPKQALRTRSFWTMLIAFALNGGILAMVTMHQMPYLEDIGIDPLAAAGVLGLMATMSLPGRVVFAWVGDRWGERRALMLGYALKTVGLLIWTTARTIPQIMVFVVLFGLGYGGTIPVQTSLRASFFGRKAYATITGYTTFFTALTNIVYPIFAGWTYDVTGSYTDAFLIIAGLQALAIVFMYLAKKPQPPPSDP